MLNDGHPGNVMTDGTLMLSLLRAHNLGGYGLGGGYEQGMSSESGFEIGKRRELRYALVPHAGGWREAGIYRDAMEFTNPLVVRKAATHEGSLPPRWGLVEISKPGAVLSALKPGREGSTVLRVFETTGTAAPAVVIKFQAKMTRAEEVNLMEDPGRMLVVAADTLRLDLRPFEIKTIKLQLQRAGTPVR